MEGGIEKERSIEKNKNPEVYFSVSNLVNCCRVQKEDGTEEVFNITIRGKDKDGRPKYQALGGGAKMPRKAVEKLEKEFGDAIRFRGGEEADDARFHLPLPEDTQVDSSDSLEQQQSAIHKRNEFVRGAFDRFSKQDPALFEDSVQRELEDELTQAKDGHDAVLSEDEAKTIISTYAGAVSPIQWAEKTSSRGSGMAEYFRIFHLFDIDVSEDVFEKMERSSAIRMLSEEDIEAIKKSTREGKSAAELSDGSVVVENVFPSFYDANESN